MPDKKKSAEYYVGKGLKQMFGGSKSSGPKRVKAPSSMGRKVKRTLKNMFGG